MRHEFLEGRNDCEHCGASDELTLSAPCLGRLEEPMANVGKFHIAFGQPLLHEPKEGRSCPSEGARWALNAAGGQLKDVAIALHNSAKAHPDDAELMRAHLMAEELGEVFMAIANDTTADVLHELTDLRYVVDGTFLTLGLQDYFLPAHREVHQANMSKLGSDGKPILNDAGRVIKGPGFKKADVAGVLYERRQHQLLTPDECSCHKDYTDVPSSCPICDGGLALCKVCRKAEAELDDFPYCPGPPTKE